MKSLHLKHCGSVTRYRLAKAVYPTDGYFTSLKLSDISLMLLEDAQKVLSQYQNIDKAVENIQNFNSNNVGQNKAGHLEALKSKLNELYGLLPHSIKAKLFQPSELKQSVGLVTPIRRMIARSWFKH